jgi:hypothetical protein
MQRLNAASCLLFALLSGVAVCHAGKPLKVEIVRTHTGIKLGPYGLNLGADSEAALTRCSGNSGSYSKHFGYHCGASALNLPEPAEDGSDFAFFYDLHVIMPNETRLVFHCSTVVNRDCEGLPEYPADTSVECKDFVFGKAAYKDCVAHRPEAEHIGIYRASLHGDRMTIFGGNWRRSYSQYGTWRIGEAQDPKPGPDSAQASETKPAPAPSESKAEPAPNDKTTQPEPPASIPNTATPASPLSTRVAAEQIIDPRVIEEAKAGDRVAQYKLGYDYYLGRGVPVDYVQAAIWWKKSAEQGYPEAQNNLGVLYNTGKGVPQSFAEAYFWQNLAAARATGDLQAQFAKNRDESGSKLWFIARLKVQEKAAKWAADHPVQPRSHEPTDGKRGQYP